MAQFETTSTTDVTNAANTDAAPTVATRKIGYVTERLGDATQVASNTKQLAQESDMAPLIFTDWAMI